MFLHLQLCGFTDTASHIKLEVRSGIPSKVIASCAKMLWFCNVGICLVPLMHLENAGCPNMGKYRSVCTPDAYKVPRYLSSPWTLICVLLNTCMVGECGFDCVLAACNALSLQLSRGRGIGKHVIWGYVVWDRPQVQYWGPMFLLFRVTTTSMLGYRLRRL